MRIALTCALTTPSTSNFWQWRYWWSFKWWLTHTHTQKKQKTRYILSRTVGSDRRNSSAKDQALALYSWYFDVCCPFCPWISFSMDNSMQPWSLELESQAFGASGGNYNAIWSLSFWREGIMFTKRVKTLPSNHALMGQYAQRRDAGFSVAFLMLEFWFLELLARFCHCV